MAAQRQAHRRARGARGDGLIGTAPDAEMIEALRRQACYGQIAVCYDADEKRGRRTAHAYWPTAGLKGRGMCSGR